MGIACCSRIGTSVLSVNISCWAIRMTIKRCMMTAKWHKITMKRHITTRKRSKMVTKRHKQTRDAKNNYRCRTAAHRCKTIQLPRDAECSEMTKQLNYYTTTDADCYPFQLCSALLEAFCVSRGPLCVQGPIVSVHACVVCHLTFINDSA